MTSDQKIRANRENAQASTGPRTRHGKTRAARNARRHGLSLSVISDPNYAEDIKSVAQVIVGKDATSEAIEVARSVAEAQIDLIRVRGARRELLTGAVDGLDYGNIFEWTKRLILMGRYERRALSRRKFAIRALDALRRQSTA